MSAYLFLNYACNSNAQRANNSFDYLMKLGNKNESLQNVYYELASGLNSMANFDFILEPKEAHELVKKLLNQTTEQAAKYDYDEACKYLINQMYIRTRKNVDLFEIASWIIADRFIVRTKRIDFIKTIK